MDEIKNQEMKQEVVDAYKEVLRKLKVVKMNPNDSSAEILEINASDEVDAINLDLQNNLEKKFQQVKSIVSNELDNIKKDILLVYQKNDNQHADDYEQFLKLKSDFENKYNILIEKEAYISNQEQELIELKRQVMQFPEELQFSIQNAERILSEKLTRQYEYEMRLVHIELESERKLYQQKIATLEEQIEQYKGLNQLYKMPE